MLDTQKPAGKMKFIVFFVRVMLLIKGIELHRHRFRHGHQMHKTDPLKQTDKLRETDKSKKLKLMK